MRRTILWMFLALVLCVSGSSALAQIAQVSGQVSDPQKAAITNAEVRIVDQATGVERRVKTNNEGYYVAPFLQPSHYKVFVQAQGFDTSVSNELILTVGQSFTLNFQMRVGGIQQQVMVDAGSQLLNTTDASVSTVIDRDFVENIPLNGRSFQDLLTLSPGVAQVSSSTSGVGVGYSGDIVVNGQRTEANYYTVDGVSANTGYAPSQLSGGAGASGNIAGLTALGTTQSLVSIDGLQEFRSTTSTYSAEYGRSPGGQFSFQTRSGTNVLHGNVYDYFRNDALDASNWFNDSTVPVTPKGAEHQNDFGGTVGGPILLPHLYDGKNKSFFFFSYEGLRLVSPQAAIKVRVPDDVLRSEAPAALQPILNAFPIANGGSDGLNDGFSYYIQAVSYPASLNNTSIRVDHRIGDKLSLFGRFADSPSNTTTYVGAVKQLESLQTRTTTLGATYSLSPQQVNDLRFNFTQSGGDSLQQSTNLGGAAPFSLSSLPGPNNSSFAQNNSHLYTVFTFAAFTNFTLGNMVSNQHQLNITDTENWTIGRHNLKFGIDWKRLATKFPSWNPEEEIAFTSESQVLNNRPAIAYGSTLGSLNSVPVYLNFSSFVQDEWKVTSRLALSLGLRWDINPAPTNSAGPNPYTVTSTDLATTMLAPQGTRLWKTDWHAFAPRFGLAYQFHPGSERNTVLRIGAGMFYDTGGVLGSLGYGAIGFSSSQGYFSTASFPLTSEQLTLPAPSVAAPYDTTVIGFDPNLKLPYSLQYNVALEQALSKNDSLTMSYVGSGGRKLLTEFETYPGSVGNSNFESGTVLDLAQGRASSNYNSFQAKYQRNLSRGLQALVSYTWSHSIDDASNNFAVYYLLRASSDFDIRHNLQAALTYLTPKVNSGDKLARLFDDWGLDLRFQARTAVPVDIIGNQELSPETGEYLQYQPNLVSGQPLYLYGNNYPGGRIINYSAFESAADGVQGDLPRNFARAFGELQLDAAIRREFPIHDQLHLQFRAEAFNVFNHPMFGPIYNELSYGPTQFGYAYSTLNSLGNLNSLYQSGGPRSLQIALKVSF